MKRNCKTKPFLLFVESFPDYDGCIEWPYAKSSTGHAMCFIDGKVRYVARHLLEKKLGRKLLPGYETLHSCNNAPCCNVMHLSEGTHQQNIQDAHRDGLVNKPRGANNPKAKLSDSDVLRIRELSDTMTQAQIAKKFNVGQTAISCILRRKTWTHV